MSKCDTCKHKADDEGWMFCDRCIHSPELEDMCKPLTNADHIRAMDDEEFAKYLAKLFTEYTRLLYDGEYTPSDEAAGKITQELLRQLQQPYESPVRQKG